MAESNLDPVYVDHVNAGLDINNLVQQVIDRTQYSPGFLDELLKLIDKHEAPFDETNHVREFKGLPEEQTI